MEATTPAAHPTAQYTITICRKRVKCDDQNVRAITGGASPPPDVFYVSPTGENSASRNGSQSEPWRTIGFALGRAEVGSGDIIVVNSDGIDGNEDSVENVRVDKSVKIRANASDPSQPVVRALSASFSVFSMTADGVEIKGLGICGSETQAAIILTEVGGCLVEGNSLGAPDENKRNYFGVWINRGSQNIVRGNNVVYNTAGINFGTSKGSAPSFEPGGASGDVTGG